MLDVDNPKRPLRFKILTIAGSGIGGLFLGLWAMKTNVLGPLPTVPAEAFGGMVAGLCAMAAAIAAMSFFAGVDESEDYVYRETHFDKLTGFHTRVAMIGKIAEAVTRISRSGQPVFMIDIDIDRFKPINDAIGYQQADELVREFATRLKDNVPKEAVIGRMGAGEFVILVPDNASWADLDARMEHLLKTMMMPYKLTTHSQLVSISAGIVAMPKDGEDPLVLLRRSNLALQRARASGIGTWSVFHPEMSRVADYRQWVESELSTALARGDFDLHYQPQFDLLDGKLVGYEALLRWRHPERGMIPPSEFIPVAEETGMICELGEWVLRRGCQDARMLPDDTYVAINLSATQFMNGDLISIVRSALADARLRPERLELEITETAMTHDREKAARIMKELSDMGISIAIDDFGTGYSNLSYLMDFSFKKLKIDRSFVSRLENDASTGAVVSTIVSLSRALGVHTLAEGVETESQAILLKAAGCDHVQGFYYGRPQPLDPAAFSEAKPKAAMVH